MVEDDDGEVYHTTPAYERWCRMAHEAGLGHLVVDPGLVEHPLSPMPSPPPSPFHTDTETELSGMSSDEEYVLNA